MPPPKPLPVCLFLIAACGASHRAADSGGGDGDGGSADGGVADAGGSDASHGTFCTYPTDCVLLPQSCCGSCGAYTHDDIVSVHRDDVSAYVEQACAGTVGCAACFMEPDPRILADCTAEGQCTYVELYNPDEDYRSPLTACEEGEECVLRVLECCACGATITESRLVAVPPDQLAALERLLCEPGTACPECAPDYSPYFAHCGGDTPDMPPRCRVDVLGP